MIIYPLEGIGSIPGIYLTQEFGGNPEIYAQFGLKGHNGLDWAAPRGTPLLAVHDGTIQFLTENTDYGTGYGKDVRLYFNEDGFTYDCIYAHLDRYEGQPREVKEGEIIGYTDNTGFSTGDHLHFGMRKLLNGAVVDYNNGYFGYFDPTPFFRKEQMARRFYIKDGAKIGAFISDGFGCPGGFAKDAEALEQLKSAFEFKGDEPTLELPPS